MYSDDEFDIDPKEDDLLTRQLNIQMVLGAAKRSCRMCLDPLEPFRNVKARLSCMLQLVCAKNFSNSLRSRCLDPTLP